MERNKEFCVIAFDPSLTAWGWVVLDHESNILAQGCIRTVSEHKKRRIRVSDDRTRRTSEIVQQLLRIIREFKVSYILSELPHGSQTATAAVMIGIVVGVVQTLADVLELPLEFFSEGDSKKCLLGKISATKEDTINRINELYEVDWSKFKYINESIADALSIHYVATKQSPVIKFMNQ